MKYVKMLGLLAVAAAALMAFAGTASATVTSGGSAYTGEISASSSNSQLDGSVNIKCSKSTVAGSTTSGATTAAITTLSFTECNGDTATPIAKKDGTYGSLKIASDGTVFAEDVEVTVQLHRTVFGFPVTTHCIYVTKSGAEGGTDVGNLTEGTTQIDLIGTNIPQTATDGACGAEAKWTGTYTINTPGALTID